VLIDFERCKHSATPQNILQVCQFLNSKSLAQALAANGKGLVLDCSAIREYCRAYKSNNYQEADFKRILGIVEGALVSPKRFRLSSPKALCEPGAGNGGGRAQDSELGAALQGGLTTAEDEAGAGKFSAGRQFMPAVGMCSQRAGCSTVTAQEEEDEEEALLRGGGLVDGRVAGSGGKEELGSEAGGGGASEEADGPYAETAVEDFRSEEEGAGGCRQGVGCRGWVGAHDSPRTSPPSNSNGSGERDCGNGGGGVATSRASHSAGRVQVGAGGGGSAMVSDDGVAEGQHSEQEVGGEGEEEEEEESHYTPSIFADTCDGGLPGATSRRGR
jgi:hypothetical protein